MDGILETVKDLPQEGNVVAGAGAGQAVGIRGSDGTIYIARSVAGILSEGLYSPKGWGRGAVKGIVHMTSSYG